MIVNLGATIFMCIELIPNIGMYLVILQFYFCLFCKYH
jgi:hypothetical protein